MSEHSAGRGRPTEITTNSVRTAIIKLMQQGKSLSVENIRKTAGIKGSAKKFSQIREMALKEIAVAAGERLN